MDPMTDTIAAIATPPVPAAIGILRLSGPQAAQIAERCFKPLGSKGLLERPSKTLVYGDLLDSGGVAIDRVLCTVSLAPHSYTGEDTAEIHCHGSPMVLQLGLEALFAAGARQAQRGEFTRRAFLNGKLDLAQAEAVGDLLDARSREGARHAASQLAGALSEQIAGIYSALLDVMAHFHAVLDYPDEDIDPFTARQLGESLSAQRTALGKLADSYRRGQYLRDGVPCAIVGRPNAGKSSLLNALVGYDRAIVTNIPGTTRDTVEERAELGGVTLRLIDTAGLRDSDDPIEQLGVERSRRAMEQAGLILVVLDQSSPADREDIALVQQAAALAPTIILLNKMDLPPRLEWTEELDIAAHTPICAKTGQGIDDLAELISWEFPLEEGQQLGGIISNARQAEAVRRALEGVGRAGDALNMGVTPDALLTDVEQALSALGELTGQSVREDITDRIFERFCVGK